MLKSLKEILKDMSSVIIQIFKHFMANIDFIFNSYHYMKIVHLNLLYLYFIFIK